ncbi:hypothetical protein L6164_026635 [Bauhinia variegata]|uniref:Uncharacterized protein n=1 Tax=Bauhinia variegata TaxID=167791 RepID=A0ACB9LQT7_BAUVA|nr:hypothetical protein L6164_026635 [Bauhinia variegata]
MWETYLKRYWVPFTICYVLLLHIFMFTSPLLKLLRQTSPLAVLTGVLTLLLGLLGYKVFHWCQKISSNRLTVSISDATSSAEEATDDPYPSHTNYEVFISFRGKDTRDNFTSHLYEALSRKKIKTFVDNRLNRGDEISSTLMRTIRGSEIYVIVFSEDYASSSWCLDELVELLKCKKRHQRLVIPIFYNIDPSNVRRQTGSYADSFVKHTRRYKTNIDKVNKWKTALIQASNLSGLDSATTRPEPVLIGKVVEDIFRKLKRNFSYDLEGLIGIHDHISATKNKGTKRIHGISLDLSKIKEVYLKPDVFENMHELEILKFYYPLGHSRGSCRLYTLNGLKNLPEELRIFQWEEYPHMFVPLDSCAKNLVEINMRHSGVKQLWDSNQHLPNLKNLDLIGSKQLVGIPDLSATPNIRHINVIACTGLSQIFSSGSLGNLEFISVSGCESLKTVKLGGNKVNQRRWRLMAVYEFFTLDRYIFSKVTMKISKSKCNAYNVRFNFVSVPVTDSSSKSMNCDSDSAMLSNLYETLKSFLPSLQLIRLFDNPSSLETLSKLVYLQLSYRSAGTPRVSVMMRTDRESFGPRENPCSPCTKRTRKKEMPSSWGDLIDLDEKLTQPRFCICDCRLSKSFHWSCLTQVSLQRSETVAMVASIHGSSSLNSLLLCDSKTPKFAVDLTFSMDAEIPHSVSEISVNLAEQQLKIDHYLFIYFLNKGLNKCFHCGNTRPNVENWSPFPITLFLDLYPKPLPSVKYLELSR